MKEFQLALRRFQRLTGFPATDCTSDGILMTDARWWEGGNLSMTCLSCIGSQPQQTAKARSGLVYEFQLAEWTFGGSFGS